MNLKKTLIYGLTAAAMLFAAGCASDPWADVPEFEVVTLEPSADGDFLEDGHFLMWWNFLGPIPQGKEPSLHKEYIPDEKILCGNRNAPRGARWYRTLSRNEGAEAVPGQVDFSRYFKLNPGAAVPSVFYACISLKSDRERKGLVLNAGSCGKLKVWINGTAVYSYEKGARPLKPDTDKVEGIILRKGFNRITVKYMDNGGDYRNQRKFCLRFTDAAGKPTRIR